MDHVAARAKQHAPHLAPRLVVNAHSPGAAKTQLFYHIGEAFLRNNNCCSAASQRAPAAPRHSGDVRRVIEDLVDRDR
jgi:hypothetical protein